MTGTVNIDDKIKQFFIKTIIRIALPFWKTSTNFLSTAAILNEMLVNISQKGRPVYPLDSNESHFLATP